MDYEPAKLLLDCSRETQKLARADLVSCDNYLLASR